MDSQSELGLLMNRRDVSELRMYISINVNIESSSFINILSESELSGFMNTLSESEPKGIYILREGSEFSGKNLT